MMELVGIPGGGIASAACSCLGLAGFELEGRILVNQLLALITPLSACLFRVTPGSAFCAFALVQK